MAISTFPTMPMLSFPVVKRDLWSTLKQEAVSGKSTRVQLWTFPRYQWEMTISALRQGSIGGTAYTELANFQGFVNSVGGAAQSFYYDDPSDDAATTQFIGTGDGATTSFQLQRTLGGFAEPVQSPTVSQIFLNGTPTSAWTLGAGGIVTFASAPGAGVSLTWTGSFVWLCRFDDDTAEFSEFMMNMWEVKKITFTSVKL
jgi:uncharacterized protein (TIGR02217 family)